MKNFLSLLSLLTLVMACNPTNDQPRVDPIFEIGQPFVLAFGQVASCSCAAPDVKFVHVITDSRCPLQAECVWAGEVVVELEINEQLVRLGLSPIQTAPAKDIIGMWSYELLAVNPHPLVPLMEDEIDECIYTLELLIEAL
ncbi:MAG: hypothetical protein DA408_11325 [Bacteroidetes bacterium]|nr:MAG: hypothetical protein C7N36_16980 [Bacteroidota bacterium]PTM12266.1 MAG: hypothetical protein DA408_11325 [Bacteroidota bacterium]